MSALTLSPKQGFQEAWLEHAKSSQAPAYLHVFKQSGMQAFSEHQLPDRKSENWKYLNLNPIWLGDFKPYTHTEGSSHFKPHFAQLDSALNIRLHNGRAHNFSSYAQAEFSACLFSQADERQQKLIQQHLGSITAQAQAAQPFADLNQALLEDGVFIEINCQQQLAAPILITHHNDAQADKCLIPSRILIVAQAGSQARVIETFSNSEGVENSLNNSVCEIHCLDNSQLEHSRLQLNCEQVMHLSAVHVALHKDSEYKGFHFTLGSQLTRNDLLVNHLQSGAHCQLNGVFLPERQQQVDFHSCIEHRVAHCTTSEVFRGIVDDQANATFNGRIHIHPDAQKTDARLSNKNLLLTNQATVNTKPELEIYADDVVCAHGATVAQINAESIFYLMSRGIARKQAEMLLSFGFINELLEELTDTSVAQELAELITQKFNRSMEKQ